MKHWFLFVGTAAVIMTGGYALGYVVGHAHDRLVDFTDVAYNRILNPSFWK